MFELKIKREAPVKIVAEIGCNHQGSMNTAHEMIKVAAACQVDYVKFQKRCMDELLTDAEYHKSYDNPNSFGYNYGTHRDALEFDIEQHATLKEWCEEEGIRYACSVWDLASAREVISLWPDYIKIPSAMNLNFPLLKYVKENFLDRPIHISLGMTTEKQINDIQAFIGHRAIYYHCTSAYPCDFKDVNLFNLKYSADDEFGFSGHHQGIAVDIAAITLGATWIERHFTLDRTMKGTDHAASLEPEGLKRLVRDIEHVYQTFTFRNDILPCEITSYAKLKKVVSL